jgi:hypothetical protein
MTLRPRFATALGGLVCALFASSLGCAKAPAHPGQLPVGVAVEPADLAAIEQRVAMTVTSTPPSFMKSSGLAGAAGGAHVKLLNAGKHELLLPVPQMADGQVPILYSIRTAPLEVGKEYRLRQREGSNVVVSVQLEGKADQVVQINWSAVILMAGRSVSSNLTNPESFLSPTACVQSGGKEVKALADRLWPSNGTVSGYAASVQGFIQGMKQQTQPRSMDATAILGSGANWICTANANLAAALLRAKSIPARSLATIPTIGRRLEMHRIVEYADRGQWQQFDPSAVQPDIPMKPWQNIIMATTTLGDEDYGMKPRMGSALGCPYGQELEFLDGGMAFWGQDFFWTLGVGLAEFDPGEEATNLARTSWSRFLATGRLTASPIRAASATSAAALIEALRTQ